MSPTSSTDPAALVREPKQARTREAWQRVLEVGVRLVEEGGVDALTITEVCRRSEVSPPSLYARVDGLAGLFAAVYDRGMAQVKASEEQLFAGLPKPGSTLEQQALAASSAIAEVFRAHAAFLRPVIGHAARTPTLLSRGAVESQRLLRRVVAAMDVDEPTGHDIARTLYAECILRTMYGIDFLSGRVEPEQDFRHRLARTAAAQARAAAG